MERKRSLAFVLKWLKTHLPDIEVLIIEQDVKPKFDLPLPKNGRHFFVYNPGLYNRCWSFNVAIKQTEADAFVFADADAFLSKDDYLSCFKALNDYEIITPNSVLAINIGGLNNEQLTFKTLDKRKIWTFASMMMMITRKGYEQIGGWDERFEGWGAEDNVLSHIAFMCLKNKSFDFPLYHIDHPRTINDGNRHANYEYNFQLAEEICTYGTVAVKRYIHRLKKMDLGNRNKYVSHSSKLIERSTLGDLTCHTNIFNEKNVTEAVETNRRKFVLAVTTYNRLDYLQEFLESWYFTSSKEVDWQIIIADDGSDDGTLVYINKLAFANTPITLLCNQRRDINHQTNTILKELSKMKFDLCFVCNDDIYFKDFGWDKLYWETIKRTGYEHLVFYDTKWRPEISLTNPIEKGNLICHCHPEQVQGAFYTITPSILKLVGYFDRNNFGFRGYEHVDYTLRCCRSGFNVSQSPFDIKNSSNYISLQSRTSYIRSISLKREQILNTRKAIRFKKWLCKQDRTFIPYNEVDQSVTFVENDSEKGLNLRSDRTIIDHVSHKLADDTLYTDRGINGYIGSILKKIYNFHIRRKWYWFPRLIKNLGLLFLRTGDDMVNIDQ